MEDAMAYASSFDTKRRLGTFGAVAVVEIVIGYALVTGLAQKLLPVHPPPHLQADNFRLPPPKPPEPQHPNDPKPQTRPVTNHDTHVLVPTDPISFTPVVPTGDVGGLGGTGHDIGEVRIPQPDPPALPRLVHGALPRGNPGLWVTPNDYPSGELRLEHHGITRFRLSIGVDGRVRDCTITGSSGYPALDAAACAKVTSRARFDPALDSTGARLEGSYANSVRWQIPE
ncbi:MAG: TonB family protein [Sphingomonadales bacterium]|nr:TonB family protein [Sphingomonadales bacterium]